MIKKMVWQDEKDFTLDGVPSHRSQLVQDFLKTKLKCCFIRAKEWPPSSRDVNPLDYF